MSPNTQLFCSSSPSAKTHKVLSIFLVDLHNAWGLGLRVFWMGLHMGPFHHANTAYKFRTHFCVMDELVAWRRSQTYVRLVLVNFSLLCLASESNQARHAGSDLHSAHFVFCGKDAVYIKNNAAFLALYTQTAVFLFVMFQHELWRCKSSAGTSRFPLECSWCLQALCEPCNHVQMFLDEF